MSNTTINNLAFNAVKAYVLVCNCGKQLVIPMSTLSSEEPASEAAAFAASEGWSAQGSEVFCEECHKHP